MANCGGVALGSKSEAGSRKSEIGISKSETNPNSLNTKAQNENAVFRRGIGFGFEIRISEFGFVSDFEIRISDFRLRISDLSV
jgi:hypothetical protein